MLRRLALALPALAACAQGAPDTGDHDSGPGAPDAAHGAPDAAHAAPDAAPDVDSAPPAAPAAPLLLTEIVLQPAGAELIEIANPTPDPVDLSDYYLSDAGTYFRLPAGDAGVAASDFIVRFPAHATLASGAVATIATDTAAAFQTAYGAAPDWSIADGTITLVEGSAATLTNGGEMVALFHWDGASDRVTDVDLMIAGAATAANSLVAKGGVAIDGPDADATTTAYAAEADTLAAQATTPGSALSTKRIALETGHEAAGGNGVDADDTSEQTGTTWDTTFTAPTPGTTTIPLP